MSIYQTIRKTQVLRIVTEKKGGFKAFVWILMIIN